MGKSVSYWEEDDVLFRQKQFLTKGNNVEVFDSALFPSGNRRSSPPGDSGNGSLWVSMGPSGSLWVPYHSWAAACGVAVVTVVTYGDGLLFNVWLMYSSNMFI